MTVYHPDQKINAAVIADVLDAELADLAAGCPPRRWRCPCGTEHSRGHFETVGIHRCLACGYTGPEGVMLDDDEPGNAEGTVTPSTECAVVDQIIPWPGVKADDLVLWDGEFCPVERINPMDYGNPAVVIAGDGHNGTIPAGTYAAVRRYVETPAGQEG